MMNQDHADAMMKSYAAMSDADLVHIVATRHTTLTKEARWALAETVKLRRMHDFDQQVQRLRNQEANERQLARQAAERRDRHRRTLQRAYRTLCLLSLLLGLAALAWRSAWATPLLLIGTVPPLFIETRKPLRRFLSALWSRRR
jgi:hypothetical protein